MTEHTPGPWGKVRNKDSWTIESSEVDVARTIAFGEEYEDEERANARLIAAAPEMYEVLREADRLYSTYALTATGGLEVGRWITSVRDCIARATGEQP
jgi:hypothetical protein